MDAAILDLTKTLVDERRTADVPCLVGEVTVVKASMLGFGPGARYLRQQT
jgi:hypothetical protein